jgi:diguanylate cyclase (GGDEF)-like protein
VAADGDPRDELDALLRGVRASRDEAELRALLAPLLRRAREDALTGLANRGKFEEVFATEVERARRYSRPLALLLCDLDAFKARNDSNGHAAGDAALARVGAALRSVSRASDLAARIGGDEFAVVLPETGELGALAFADKLRRALAEGSDPLSLSIGIAALSDGSSDRKALFEAADRELYRVKARGPYR